MPVDGRLRLSVQFVQRLPLILFVQRLLVQAVEVAKAATKHQVDTHQAGGSLGPLHGPALTVVALTGAGSVPSGAQNDLVVTVGRCIWTTCVNAAQQWLGAPV